MEREVYIMSAVRTPIGSLGGALSTLSAPKLGALAIAAAVERAGIENGIVEQAYLGNVLSANQGQAPARQAALGAGLPHETICTTVNKVCASGMKAIALGAQSILLGDADVVVAGGMESMSSVPHYVESMRSGTKLGHGVLVDGLIRDGLWDPYHDYHMGSAAELCARAHGVSRERQDAHAAESYRRAQAAIAAGHFDREIVPVMVPRRKGEPLAVSIDEEPAKVIYEKIPTLAPVFEEGGTITAANASNVNDGAAALVLMSRRAAGDRVLEPLARVVAHAEAAQAPEWFTTSPALAIPKALAKAGLRLEDVDYFEINEAYSVVALVNAELLGIDPEKVNVHGGAVALGHPLGCSGARIVATLLSVLEERGGKIGVAAICNGGGGASAMVIERL
jgi:acetyl-CoA C-acetyltransferase